MVKIIFHTNPLNLRLIYLEKRISNYESSSQINTFWGNDQCNSDGDDCFPQYSCLSTTYQCKGVCHPSCGRCVGFIPFRSPNDYTKCYYCSPFSKRYGQVPDVDGDECLPMDYFNMAPLQQEISISDLPAKYTEEYTMGFWLRLEDWNDSKGVHSVIFDDIMMISTTFSGSYSDAYSFCSIFLKYTPEIKDFTQTDQFVANSIWQKYSNIKTVMKNKNNISGKWHYKRCTYSLSNRKFSLMQTIDNPSTLQKDEGELSNPVLFKMSNTDVYHDTVFRNYKQNHQFSLKIRKPSGSGLQAIFMRNLQIFTEYVSPVSSIQYFSLSTVIATKPIPSLYLLIDFDNWEVKGAEQIKFEYTIVEGGYNKNTKFIYLDPVLEYSFGYPMNFYRLNFHSLITPWENFDFSNQLSILCNSPNDYCYAQDKPLTCTEGYFMDYESNSGTCVSTCPSGKMPNWGSNPDSPIISHGTCSMSCGDSTICLTTGEQLNKYSDNFSCVTTSDPETSRVNVYLQCVNTEDSLGQILYWGDYFNSPASIKIPVTPNLENYFFEIWYFVDFRFRPQSSASKYYVLVTSGLRIYREGGDFNLENKYQLEDSNGIPIGAKFSMKSGNWHKLAFHIAKSNTDSAYYINYYPDIKSPSLNYSTSSDMKLNYIYFCSPYDTTCSFLSNYSWFSGYYKLIKIWNGQSLNAVSYLRINKYFNLEGGSLKINDLTHVYPLNLVHMTDYTVHDAHNPGNNALIRTIAYLQITNFSYQIWNFSRAFEAPQGKYFHSIDTTDSHFKNASTADCPANCKICNPGCLFCQDGYMFNDSWECVQSSAKYYFNSLQQDINFKSISGLNNHGEFTVAFFLNVIGMLSADKTMTEFDIFKFNYILVLRVNVVDKSLKLMNSITSQVYATYPDFYENRLNWYHLSLAFSSSLKKMYFQVNFTHILLTVSSNDSIFNSPQLTMKIPKESIGFYAYLFVYNGYIEGPSNISYFSSNSNYIEPVKKMLLNVDRYCLDINDLISPLFTQDEVYCGGVSSSVLEPTKYCNGLPFTRLSDVPSAIIDASLFTCSCPWKRNDIFKYQLTCKSECPIGSTVNNYNECLTTTVTCRSNSCMNNGSCSVKLEQIVCQCPSGFIGAKCEYSITDSDKIISDYNNLIDNFNTLSPDTSLSSSLITKLSELDTMIDQGLSLKPNLSTFSDKITNILMNQISLVESGTIPCDYNLLKICNLAINLKIQEFTNDPSATYLQSELDEIKSRTEKLIDIIIEEKDLSETSTKSVLLGNKLFSVQLSSTDDLSESDRKQDALKNGLSLVNLDKCEKKIREFYNIPPEDELLLMKVDYNPLLNLKNLNNIYATNSVKFAFYDPNSKNKYDMDVCNNTPVDINIPLPPGANFNLTLLQDLVLNNIDPLNPEDQAFQSRCMGLVDQTTEFDTTINFRRSNYFQNVTAGCSEGCTYQGLTEENYINCNCTLNTNQESFTTEMEETILSSIPTFNWEIIFCVDIVFDHTKIPDNMGLYTVITLVVLFTLGITLLPFLQKNIISDQLEKIIESDCEFFNKDEMSAEEYFNRSEENNLTQNHQGEVLEVPEQVGAPGKNDSDISDRSEKSKKKLLVKEEAAEAGFNKIEPVTIEIEKRGSNELLVKHAADVEKDNEENKEHTQCPNNPNHLVLVEDFPDQEDFHINIRPKISSASSINSFVDKKPAEIAFNNFTPNEKQLHSINHNESKSEVLEYNTLNNPSKDNESKRKHSFGLNHKATSRDYENLSMQELVKYDQRTFWHYIWDSLMEEHPFINLFWKKSLMEPIFIRIILFIYVLSLGFATNAMLFSDDYIDKRANAPKEERDGFIYTFLQEIPKTICSIVITCVMEFLIRLILIVPNKVKDGLNDSLKTRDPEKVKDQYKIFLSQMKIQYIIFSILATLFTLFFWYYVIMFCGVYKMSSSGWLQGTVISLALDWLGFVIFIPIFVYLIKIFVKRFPRLLFIMVVTKFLCGIARIFFG